MKIGQRVAVYGFFEEDGQSWLKRHEGKRGRIVEIEGNWLSIQFKDHRVDNIHAKQVRKLRKRSFRVGDRVRMYGSGRNSTPFWAGYPGTIVGYTEISRTRVPLFEVRPDEFPQETHQMQAEQLRLIKRNK